MEFLDPKNSFNHSSFLDSNDSLSTDFMNPLLDFGNEKNNDKMPGAPGMKNGKDYVDVNYSQMFDQFSSFKTKEAVLSDGSVVKLNLKPPKTYTSKSEEIAQLTKENNSLMDIRYMLNQLEIEKHVSSELSEKQALVDKEPEFKTVFTRKETNKSHQLSLWAEKYRPQSFLDLIGNERTNRYILSWLNHWNKAVHNREIEYTENDKNKHKMKGKDKESDVDLKDPFDRPNHRILMIHGPPGIGKTSIAHVIAKQLKYEVMEINASDERSGADLENKIRTSLTSLTFSGKPVCLVIDEIDGTAESGMTRILLNILREDRLATLDYQKSSDKSLKGKKKNRLLMRPIITVCNNAYANSIDKLKPHCEIVKFTKTNNRLIKSRLAKICKLENMNNITDSYLDSLIISSNGDLRNCLNHLQFSSFSPSQSQAQPQAQTPSNSSAKDMPINWFTMLDKIFYRSIDKSKETIFNELISSNQIASTSIDKLVQGCFQSYLSTIELSRDLRKPMEANDWICFHDILSSTHDSDLFSLSSLYSFIVPMKFFLLFNEISKYNNKATKNNLVNYEAQQKLHEIQEKGRLVSDIITKFKQNLMRSTSWSVISNLNSCSDELSIFEIDYVSRIITPAFKSTVSLRPNETTKFDTAVQLIMNYNLDFQMIKDQNSSVYGGYITNTTYPRFSPNLHELRLSPMDTKTEMKLNQTIQLLQSSCALLKKPDREMITYQIKRKQDQENSQKDKDAQEKQKKRQKNFSSSVEFFKSKYSELNAKLVDGTDSSSSSLSSVSTNNGKPEKSVMSMNEYRIWVKYHEGFSNAVKKNIKFNDLFE